MGDRFFGGAFKEGQPISRKGFAAGIRGMSRALDKMSIRGGKVTWSSDNVPKLIPFGGAGGKPFSGIVKVKGKIIDLHEDENYTAKAFVVVNFTDGTAWYHEGPEPNTSPPNEQWYTVANTSGDIVIV